jgi:hypothetical protein
VARLTAKARKKIPTSQFAGPGRSYPVPDKSHAANAKARATQAVKAGRMSKSEESRIDAKANRVLGHGKSRESHSKPEHGAKERSGRNETMMKIKSAGERHREAKEHHAPKAHKMHEAKHHVRGEKHHEPKREARMHERAGEKRHMRKEHEKGRHHEVHHHFHHHHHHGE